VNQDPATGAYSVAPALMREAIAALAARLLMLQGDGDREAAAAFLATAEEAYAAVRPDLDRLAAADIPRAIVYHQGMEILAGSALAARSIATAMRRADTPQTRPDARDHQPERVEPRHATDA
jgi:hypothetical protein